MDFIKLSSVVASPTLLGKGEAINGYTSALWVERYREPGEFKFEAPLSSGLREFLPIDSFVSHQNTEHLMIVENHEIKQPNDADPTITITGRCFTTFMEQRTVGDSQAFASTHISDWIWPADPTWDQMVALINTHIIATDDFDDGLSWVAVDTTCTGPSTSEERNIKAQPLYDAVAEILKVDDLGIRCIRPTPTEETIYFRIYRGTDISTKVRFSWMLGDLENIEYLFSNKKLKNQARVMGRWVQVVYNPTGAANLERRTMIVDASYIDERQPAYPTGLAETLIIAAMTIKGDEALKAQNNVSITQADVSENAKLRYRTDYNLGDLVTVDGDFGSSAVMRVIEYAEVEDENGVNGHPTLAIPGDD